VVVEREVEAGEVEELYTCNLDQQNIREMRGGAC